MDPDLYWMISQVIFTISFLAYSIHAKIHAKQIWQLFLVVFYKIVPASNFFFATMDFEKEKVHP